MYTLIVHSTSSGVTSSALLADIVVSSADAYYLAKQ